jgi:hypothetical protein
VCVCVSWGGVVSRDTKSAESSTLRYSGIRVMNAFKAPNCSMGVCRFDRNRRRLGVRIIGLFELSPLSSSSDSSLGGTGSTRRRLGVRIIGLFELSPLSSSSDSSLREVGSEDEDNGASTFDNGMFKAVIVC